MSDPRDTGEHIFGSLVRSPGSDAPSIEDAQEPAAGPVLGNPTVEVATFQESAATAPESAGFGDRASSRIADLTTQIDFLDREIARYRELLEQERIRHSTELANQQLAADTRLDEQRRDERRQTQALHDSYRGLLRERQIEFEQALSKALGESAQELADERQRYEDMLSHERTRREVHLEASRKQTIDELNESHHHSRQSLQNELAQASETIKRLQADVDVYVERASLAEARSHELDHQLTNVQKRLGTVDEHNDARIEELESQLTIAARRLDAERQRSAATLAELLERSASIAAEADKARSDYAAEQARSEHVASSARQRAEADYAALARAADDRASRALVREAELESVIAELRDHIDRKRA